jgi:hypothetical protein
VGKVTRVELVGSVKEAKSAAAYLEEYCGGVVAIDYVGFRLKDGARGEVDDKLMEWRKQREAGKKPKANIGLADGEYSWFAFPLAAIDKVLKVAE